MPSGRVIFKPTKIEIKRRLFLFLQSKIQQLWRVLCKSRSTVRSYFKGGPFVNRAFMRQHQLISVVKNNFGQTKAADVKKSSLIYFQSTPPPPSPPPPPLVKDIYWRGERCSLTCTIFTWSDFHKFTNTYSHSGSAGYNIIIIPKRGTHPVSLTE